MLSGFFLAFAFLREKAEGAAAFGMGVLQRLLRIWPAYILAMFFYYSLFMQTNSGIFWSKAWADVSMCRSMWREVLFVANFIDRGQEMCLGWGWYLQVDFQLFIFGLLLLFLYRRSKAATLWASVGCMTASTIFNIVFTFNHEVRIFTDLGAFVNFEDFMLDLY
jgi:peptidoglycan/LPS O-acetylase OafA/YrhL